MTADSNRRSAKQIPARQYLSDMFAMNPVWESQSILIHRQRTLHLAPADGAGEIPSDYDEQQRIRRQGRERLKAIQSRYFQMSAAKLRAGLDSLAPDRHPELAATVARLNVAANHRDAINSMLDDPRYDRDLAIAFGRALTLAPADAGFAKEQYLQSIAARNSFGKAIRSVRHIEQIDRALIDLERDWFATIENLKKPWFSGTSRFVVLSVIAIVAGMAVRFITDAMESGR